MYMYECKDGRVRCVIKDKDGRYHTKSYPRYVVENALNITLPDDVDVHHKDENPLNNDLGNLEIVKRGEHRSMHAKIYEDVVIRCPQCGAAYVWTADKQKNFYSNQSRKSRKETSCGLPFCSRHCSGKYLANLHARVVELEYTSDLSSDAGRIEGSTPSASTNNN